MASSPGIGSNGFSTAFTSSHGFGSNGLKGLTIASAEGLGGTWAGWASLGSSSIEHELEGLGRAWIEGLGLGGVWAGAMGKCSTHDLEESEEGFCGGSDDN